MTSVFWQYSYLQMLDFLTTLAFLLVGVQEGNPLVRVAMELSPSPIFGLLGVKAAAMALGVYSLKAGRFRLLERMNWVFALVVAWNLVALVVGAARLKPLL
ncbi:MAG: hypothetical protein JNN08_30255 [Bryobacterales bacterium]|nr:hypothetical protein [Bryobacterales bacterium]